VALLVITATGCGPESASNIAPQSELRVWVGELANSDVALGIVGSAKQSTLFFCGGNRTFTDHTHWFLDAGPLSDAMQIEDGGWHVSISSANEQVVGTLVIDGLDSGDFSAEAVAPGTLAGVYDAFAPCGHAGLIVRQAAGDRPTAMQGTCLLSDAGSTSVEQVNPVMPVMRSAGSGIVAELTDDPSQQFTLLPLSFQGI
jgi:hypothetical protein